MLDNALLPYCNRGLADSTQRTYLSGINRYLAQEGIIPATIHTYLATVRRAQIMRGHPEPRESSYLPRLRLVQNRVRRECASSDPSPPTRPPITPLHLQRLRSPAQSPPSYEECLLLPLSVFRLLSRWRDYGPQRVSFRPESAPGDG